MVVDNVAQAVTTDRPWAQGEWVEEMARIRRLQAKIDDLQRSLKIIENQRDRTLQAYERLIKEIAHCPRCLELLKNNKEYFSIAPTGVEIRETLSSKNTQGTYHDSNLPFSYTSAATNATADEGLNVPTPPLSAGLLPSNSICSSFTANVSPPPRSRDTQPPSGSISGNSSPIHRSRDASSIPSSRHEDRRHSRRVGKSALRLGQVASLGEHLPHEDRVPHSSLAKGNAKVASRRFREKDAVAKTSSGHSRVERGRQSSLSASSDRSMRSVPDLRGENEIMAEGEPSEQVSADSSISSSDETDEDAAESRGFGLAPSVDNNTDSRRRADLEYAGRGTFESFEARRPTDRQKFAESRTSKRLIKPSAPTLQHINGSAEDHVQSLGSSSDTNLETMDVGQHNARSPSASALFSASEDLIAGATQDFSPLGSQSLAVFTPSIQSQQDPESSAMFAPATDRRSKEDLATDDGEDSDTDLKTAIRRSYAKFGLSGQRIRFCYEPQTLDPTAINLNTNWKLRSRLNEPLVEKLLQSGSEIATFLPESDTKKANEKEIDLIQRLCNRNRTHAACNSLKEIVGALRREREVTKDELNLVEFEIYSTLIVMKHQNETEVRHLFRRTA